MLSFTLSSSFVRAFLEEFSSAEVLGYPWFYFPSGGGSSLYVDGEAHASALTGRRAAWRAVAVIFGSTAPSSVSAA